MTPVVKAVAEVLPSVVNIGTERIISGTFSPWGGNDPFDNPLREFFAEQGEVKTTSLGSGFIIDSEGLVVTNAHVVNRASKINIILENGESFTGKIIASDEVNDISLLKIDDVKKHSFKPIKFGIPDDLFLGEQVIAVGNPYGLGHSISCGVLSATGRKAVYEGKVIFSDILQTDAAINPGNSGGPLININAEIIGINTAMHREAQGIGFAVPLKRLENVMAKWLIPERFGDYSLGIVPGVRKSSDGRNNEIFIEEVINASPAWKAGLRGGEILKEVGGIRTENLVDICGKLWKMKSGDSIELKTADGKSYTLKVTKLPVMDGAEMAKVRLGFGLQELTPQLAEALDYPFEGGLIVSDISKELGNVSRGDILIRLGDHPINTFNDIPRALQNKHFGDNVDAMFGSVVRKGGRYFILRKNVSLPLK